MNRIHEAFDEIRASDKLKERALQKCMAKKTVMFFPQAIAACLAFVILLSGAGVWKVSVTEAAYVTIDINPSVGMSLNRFNKVMSLDAYNDEAKDIISEIDFDGKTYCETVDNVVTAAMTQGYDTSSIEKYIESESDSFSREISTVINESCPNANTSCHKGTNKKKALEYNISPGKYYIIEKILQYGGTVDDYKDMSMKELKEIYSQYADEDVSAGQQMHNGAGSHMGNGQNSKHGQKNMSGE